MRTALAPTLGRICRLPPVVLAVGVLLPATELRRFEYAEMQMGTVFRMLLYAPDEQAALVASAAAYDRIRELNAICSDYDPDSELSRLVRESRYGRPVPVGADLWLLLQRAQQLAHATGGAFDVSAGPLVQLWREARQTSTLPSADSLAAAKARVGHQNIRLIAETHSVELRVRDMRLDLGAIAKGYAVDEALRVLRRHGISSALVSGGGDMAAGDPPPERTGWRVALAALDVPNGSPPRLALLANAALATSGDLFQHVEIDGQRYSHIADPRTGFALTDRSRVVVIARDCLTADSLSTAVSVLGPESGRRLVESTPGAVVSITRLPNGRAEVVESASFASYVESAVTP